MEQIFEIINHIDNPFVLGCVIAFVSFVYMTKQSWMDVVKSIGNTKKRGSKYGLTDLVNHDLFHELKTYKTYKIDFYTHEKFDNTKTKIFADFLQMKIDATSENMMKICQDSFDEMSKQELKSLVNKYFNCCNMTLEKNLIGQFKEKGLTTSDAQMIMDKFYSIRNDSMKKYQKRIDSIFACDFYQSNFDLVLALYEVIAFEIEDVVDHGKEVFDHINGTFYDLEYET